LAQKKPNCTAKLPGSKQETERKKTQANSHNALNERDKEGKASRTVTSNQGGQTTRVTTPTPTCVLTPALQNSGITVAGSAMSFLEGKIQTNKQTKGRISVPSAKQNKKNIPLK